MRANEQPAQPHTANFGNTRTIATAISPAQHAVLDYGGRCDVLRLRIVSPVASQIRRGAAFVNGGLIVGMSILTNYPRGLFRTLSFRAHRTGDIAQAALAGLGPILFGFANDPEAKYLYGQAASEAGVIAATDWNASA